MKTIVYYCPDLERWVDLNVPGGLRDKDHLKRFISMCFISRKSKRAAFKAAKSQYDQWERLGFYKEFSDDAFYKP